MEATFTSPSPFLGRVGCGLLDDANARVVLDNLEDGRVHQRVHITVMNGEDQILKDAGKPLPDMMPASYDLVYCAGLFDYLSDRICKKLMSIFYDLVAPGGLLVATNVDSSNPSRNWMEYVVEWHLVYRDRKILETLKPDSAPPEVQIKHDVTGVNIYIEVRKPRANA